MDFSFQVDLCYEELVPRLKRLAREIDGRALIFGLMCHLAWGLQSAQFAGCCTREQALLLLRRSRRARPWRHERRGPLLAIGQVDLTELQKQHEGAGESWQPFDVDAAEAFKKIALWLSPMSRATSDWVVFTCLADVLVHLLDGQDARVTEVVWEWISELALTSSAIAPGT
jgi:hypothetical protein